MKKLNSRIVVFLFIFHGCAIATTQGNIEKSWEGSKFDRSQSFIAWNEFALSRAERQQRANTLSTKVRSAKQSHEAAALIDVCIRNSEFTDYSAFKETGYTPTDYSLLMAVSYGNSIAIKLIRNAWPHINTGFAEKYLESRSFTPIKKAEFEESLGLKKKSFCRVLVNQKS